jgi:hypothetical protein
MTLLTMAFVKRVWCEQKLAVPFQEHRRGSHALWLSAPELRQDVSFAVMVQDSHRAVNRVVKWIAVRIARLYLSSCSRLRYLLVIRSGRALVQAASSIEHRALHGAQPYLEHPE